MLYAFAVGMVIGGWGMLFFCNRFYRSDIWEARRQVYLAELNVRRERQRAIAESIKVEIDDALNRRINQ